MTTIANITRKVWNINTVIDELAASRAAVKSMDKLQPVSMAMMNLVIVSSMLTTVCAIMW